MQAIKPAKLNKGEVIGLITPASTPDLLTKIQDSIKYLEGLGYRVKLGKNVGKQYGYLGGLDEERLSDIHDMFSDKNVKAIISIRGGYGTIRLLDKINFNLIRRNPKIFVGYSDITALQLAIYVKTGLITFSGPMAAVDFANEIDPFTEDNFWRMVTSNKKIGKVKNPNEEKISTLTKGIANGRLIGGNLSLIGSLLGTPYLPKFDKSILFLEDVDEKPYRVDRYFSQMKLAKIFDKMSGMILCNFTDCEETDPSKKSLSINDVVYEYFSSVKKPIIYNVIYGHVKSKNTIPLGVRARINATKGEFEILEGCVR
ncbi:MAG: LD-carboxypeptidase [Ignavibacteria bacterium]|nr:LD-carboxypeptidase [Ignavibacteria bacterium]